ncbi:anhydro-N-acetylmuramic acid kinase [Sandaracinobacteroides saxicola]|uniref:Anhydro-N-acetylmuramic acid kinase n=1 Tax=Sandaracinobacteroides saxicola TaxID=2759707 RepID=A0A7G5IEA3_9SPHN|nr:anhydro-N-acetylmuramic acid kinase [Sandaracinobacteroides saxicola]QMW21695.1 anhydro-N-acetylmuramic acid kinase [Sandaracinobacteroides saxicola]
MDLQKPVRVIGLMSGTSADGVDAALIESDGERHVRPLAFVSRAYTAAERAAVLAAGARARGMAAPGPDAVVDEAARLLTLAHAETVAMLPGQETAELIGFHGQTVVHRPEQQWTWQVGDATLLAQLCGRPVVHDFRSADVAAGGQGAPLTPGYHRARLQGGPATGVLNLGGVGNLTWFSTEAWGAFDTGPGNALIDDWVGEHAGLTHDAGGAIAAAGRVDEAVLCALLDNPWFDMAGPKSLDRNDFSTAAARGLGLRDGAATLAAFTAETVVLALRLLPVALTRILVTGGGRHNPVLMAMIAGRTELPVLPVEALGWNGDALEAEAFGWLAVRSMRGLPLSWPETTGVPRATTGGALVGPDGGTFGRMARL